MVLPCLCGRHGLPSIQIIPCCAIQDVEVLLLSPFQSRRSGHENSGHECAKVLTFGSIRDSRPSELILILGSVEMSNVKFSRIDVVQILGQNIVSVGIDLDSVNFC